MAGRLSRAASSWRCDRETREEALTHIENAILMILAEMELNGVSPPADEPVPDSVVLTFAAEGEVE